MKHSMKDIMQLLELHSIRDSEFDELVTKGLSGSGTKAAARMLYFRLLALSLDSQTDVQRWILKPKSGLTRPEAVSKFLSDETKTGINSTDMLRYFSISTFTKVFRQFMKEEILFVDDFNRMFLKYPVNGKLLSLVYAAKAIKSSYKKKTEETSLDKPDEKSVESSSEYEDNDDSFWDQT